MAILPANQLVLETGREAAFPTDYSRILDRVAAVRPDRYGRNRNFIDGDVTRLSPYISRGVISTKQVLNSVLDRGYQPDKIEKFIQELAWRDYWQQVWLAKGDDIDSDLRSVQDRVAHHQVPTAFIEAKTGITAIDAALKEFYDTGYLHNHVRMYVAAMACNVAQSHWREPARWMYYHLLDADWASNALSWQWVAGSNSKKKYLANQENINRYCHTDQTGTYLDVSYDAFAHLPIPQELEEITVPFLHTPLPETGIPLLHPDQPTLLYTAYNLDPEWRADEAANRVLILEPDHFACYPMSEKTIDFVLELGQNIPGLQVFSGNFQEVASLLDPSRTFYKEHPFNAHFVGQEDPRDWMFDVQGYFSSFFGFWKKAARQLR